MARKKVQHTGPFTVNAGSITQGGFKTLAAAKKHASGLYSRGLLFGRVLRIVDAAGHEIVSKEYNPSARNAGLLSRRKTKKYGRLKPADYRGKSRATKARKKAKKTAHRKNPGKFKVYDSNRRFVADVGNKTSAKSMARVVGGYVLKGSGMKPIYDSRNPAGRKKAAGRKRNAGKRNGGSYRQVGASIPPGWSPKKGDVVYLEGVKTTIKRVGVDDGTPYVWFTRSVRGTSAMSVANLRQAARIDTARNPMAGLPIGKWFNTAVDGVKTQVRRTKAGFEIKAAKA